MTDERRQRILQIADELESQGLTATNDAVFAKALGHRGDVVQTMKQRRAERAGAGGDVAVLEEDEEGGEVEDLPTMSAARLAAQLTQLEAEYKGMYATLESLWALDHAGTVDLSVWNRMKWLEAQCGKNFQTQEQYRAALAVAEQRETVLAA
jgi:hypothetical protein